MYLRVIWNGTIGTAEEFSVGASFIIDSPFVSWDQDSGDEVASAVAAITIPTIIRGLNAAPVVVRSIRVEGREDNGTVVGASEVPLTVEGHGQASTIRSAPQTAVVVSFRSATPGQSGRGRLYWPATGLPLNNAFQLEETTVQGIADAFASYLQSISEAIRDNAGLFPWTQVQLAVASTTKGQQARVTRIQVGNVLDTQRRRRNGLVEAYQTIAYPPS